MNVAELKNNIHRLVVETDDADVLMKAQDVLTVSTNGSSELTDYERNMIERGIKDHEEGRVHTNEEVKTKFNEWVKKHS